MSIPVLVRKRGHLPTSDEGESSAKREKSTKPASECSCESYDLYLLGLLGRPCISRTDDFQSYDFREPHWSQVDDFFDCDRRSGFAVAEFRGRLWILGGCRPNGDARIYHVGVHSFNQYSRLWTREKSMSNSRADFCAVVVEGSLYAIGGKCMRTREDGTAVKGMRKAVEQLEGDEWRPCAPLSRSTACFASCVMGDRIYIAGGLIYPDDDDYCTGAVEYYSTSQNLWTIVTGMTVGRKSFGLALVNDRMYAVGGDDAGSVVWIDSMCTRNSWSRSVATLPTQLTTELSSYDVFVMGGEIYVVGQGDLGAVFQKLRLQDFVWENVEPAPGFPWLSTVVRVALIKNRPCENESRLRSTS